MGIGELVSSESIDVSAWVVIVTLICAGIVRGLFSKHWQSLKTVMLFNALLVLALAVAFLSGVVYVAVNRSGAPNLWSGLWKILSDSANPHSVWARMLVLVSAFCFMASGVFFLFSRKAARREDRVHR